MSWTDEAIFVEASDGSPIYFCVPKDALSDAADIVTDQRIVETGGIEPFINRAIESRYYAYKAAGGRAYQDQGGAFILTVEKKDFIPN